MAIDSIWVLGDLHISILCISRQVEWYQTEEVDPAALVGKEKKKWSHLEQLDHINSRDLKLKIKVLYLNVGITEEPGKSMKV